MKHAPGKSLPWPFAPHTERNSWVRIDADGFTAPVPGAVYDGHRLDGGVPLGGLGTGYLTLEGSGRIGRCSIYNDIVPPVAWDQDWLVVRDSARTASLSTADIDYWGHFPVADLCADLPGMSIGLGIRAFAPFILGDAAASNLPAALFEILVENRTSASRTLELELRFPAPPQDRQGTISLYGPDLQSTADQATAAVPVQLGPYETSRLRFVFAWHFPQWRDSGHELHTHRYAQRHQDAPAVAEYAWRNFDTLLHRTLGWQQAIFDAEDLPDWLRDALVQGLYSLAKNSVWIARTRGDEWWGPDGWFTHNESHTDCPITDTMVCRMHGHFPALFFFPELERTALEAFRHFQIADGEVPFSYGMGTSLRDPRYHCQHPLNSGQYVQLVYRYYLRTGDRDFLDHFLGSVKKAVRYQYTLDDDDDGLIDEQPHVRPGEIWPANQFYDLWPWEGVSAYVAGTWLATLRSAIAIADVAGDTDFAEECRHRLERAKNSYQDRLWNGRYYRLWDNARTGTRSDVSLGNQLMAQWCTRVAGLPDVLPADSVEQALSSIAELNVAAAGCGIANATTPDGRLFSAAPTEHSHDHGANTFVGEGLCAAMTFIYQGRPDTGLGIARTLYEGMALTWRSPWNQRCILDAGSGRPLWGQDYYSNLIIWVVPMALAGHDVGMFCSADGLAGQVMRTGRSSNGGEQ